MYHPVYGIYGKEEAATGTTAGQSLTTTSNKQTNKQKERVRIKIYLS